MLKHKYYPMRIARIIHPSQLRLLGLVILCVAAGAGAQVAAESGAIAQSYQANDGNGQVSAGALVSFTANGSGTVELATTATAQRLVGIVSKNPTVALGNGTAQTQIVLSGTTLALVSDINGPVKSGDKIAPSPIAGVGMKATTDGQIVGTAQSPVTVSKTTTITDKDHKQHQVKIGYVTLQVGTAYYQAPGSDFLPPFIQNIANSLAGRQVSLIRVLLAALVVLLGFISVVILVSSGVRTAMQSIGRNPLAAPDIRRGLYQVMLIAIVVAGGAALTGYLVLRA